MSTFRQRADRHTLLSRLAAKAWGGTRSRSGGALSDTAERILTTGATVSAILLSLTGGLALVVRSLKQTDLSLSLSLTRAPEGGRQDGRSEGAEFLPSASQARARR